MKSSAYSSPSASAPQVVHVRQLVGSEWLVHNWEFVVLTSLCSLPIIYYIYTLYQRSSARARSIYEFSLAQTMLQQGRYDAAQSIYQTILRGGQNNILNAELLYRAYYGLSKCLYEKEKYPEALEAIEQAVKERGKRAGVNGNKNSDADTKKQDDPDSNPFTSSFTPLPLSSLYHHRGLIHDALKNISAADEDYAQAMKLDSQLTWLEGYAKRREFEERIKGNGKGKEGEKNKEVVAAATAAATDKASTSNKKSPAKPKTAAESTSSK